MNKDTILGDLKTFAGEVKRQWGKFTDDHVTQIDGDHDKISGQIQKVYGIGQDEADNQVSRWKESFDSNSKV